MKSKVITSYSGEQLERSINEFLKDAQSAGNKIKIVSTNMTVNKMRQNSVEPTIIFTLFYEYE